MTTPPELIEQWRRQAASSARSRIYNVSAADLTAFAALVAEHVAEQAANECLGMVNEGNYAYARACRDCAAAIREGK